MTILLMMLGALAGEVDPEVVLREELARAEAAWSDDEDAPYYVALALQDQQALTVAATDGALDIQRLRQRRSLDVDLRVGSSELDSTHALRGFSGLSDDDRERIDVAWGGPGEAVSLRHAVYTALDARYREARERIVLLRGELAVRVEEEDPAPDFSSAPTVVERLDVPPLVVDAEAWAGLLVDLSAETLPSPAVLSTDVRLSAVRKVDHFVDTEGTRLRHGGILARFGVSVTGIADDGDQVTVYRSVDVHDPATLPAPETLRATVQAAVGELEALLAAPRVGPYQGPVLLSGKASGVFFHEVMGHRVEGHRQRGDDEGKTFLEFVGRSVLPPFIDVYDDPTLERLEGHDLNGFYAYDDEGVAASRATLVTDGIFQGFLMGRTPVAGFDQSNGHGRRSAGRPPTSRMGNTIIDAERTSTDAQLRRQLLAEAKAQGLDYAYVVEEIAGGFTLTGRVIPNAFNVRASRTRRVWVDGRPDELVRGIDLVGTPLVAFRSILAAGDSRDVFNGYCGAESGWVPVSAVAPPLLFRRLEFQLKEKGSQPPPLLPKPVDADGEAVLP